MWLKIDDALIEHPKMFAAGRHLGRRGRARAFCVYMAGLSWVNRHLTDGKISEEAVRSFSIDEHPVDVATVLSLDDVQLWHREEGGYRIHDYHDHNPESKKVKAKLQKDRDRKRQEREEREARKSGGNPCGLPEGIHQDVQPDISALARARARSQPLPLLTTQKDHRASPARFPQPVENLRVLKALIWREVHAAYDDPSEEFSYSNVSERLKVVAARAGLTYSSDFFHDQVEAAVTRVPLQRSRRRAA